MNVLTIMALQKNSIQSRKTELYSTLRNTLDLKITYQY